MPSGPGREAVAVSSGDDRPFYGAAVVRCPDGQAAAARVRQFGEHFGARVADLYAAMEEELVTLHLVMALDAEGGYVDLTWPVSGEQYPAISEILPAAFVEECEIFEQFGVRPADNKPLNRVAIPPRAEAHFPRLGPAPGHEGRHPRAPHYVAGEAFEFPFGPVRAVAQESLYIGLVTSGEEVIDLYLMQWHKHRGLERRLQGLPPERALFFVERMEGLSAVGNGWAFCRALEGCAGVQVPPPIERVRGIALELERLYNHAAAVAALAQATGLSVGQAQAEIVLEQLLRLNSVVFGHRYLFGVLALGGVHRAPEAGALRELLGSAVDGLRREIEALQSTNSFMDRLEACGIVSPEVAQRLAVVGPVARGSGQNRDARRDHPFGPYLDERVEVATRASGDVLSRLEVVATEAAESARLIGEFCRAGLRAQASSRPVHLPRSASALGWSESSRGESLVSILVDDNELSRVRLRPASVRNWRAFDDAARSRNVFTDVPIIEASFWLTVAGFAR